MELLFREPIVLQVPDKKAWQVKDGTTVRQLGLISSVRRWEELAGTRGQTQVSNYCWVLKERSCETMKAVTLNAFQLLRDEPLLCMRSGLFSHPVFIFGLIVF